MTTKTKIELEIEVELLKLQLKAQTRLLEDEMMTLRDKAVASEILARHATAENADLRIETKERWIANDNLREELRKTHALYTTTQDINNGLRADHARTQNELREQRTLVIMLRGQLSEAKEKYDTLDFSVNESVKKSSAYQTLAHEHEIFKIVLRDLGFKAIPTPPQPAY